MTGASSTTVARAWTGERRPTGGRRTRQCGRSAGAAGSVGAAASAAWRYGVLSPRAASSPTDAQRESRRALP